MRFHLAVFVLAVSAALSSAQTAADSVTITFRAYGPSGSPVRFVPGQFNDWGPQSPPNSGQIASGAASQMAYDGAFSAWTKKYTFKIHDPLDGSRTLGDSVYQYKLNAGGSSNGWYSDTLNPEQNPADNNNSVLRLTKLFWFQFYARSSGSNYDQLVVGLGYANSDSIASIRLETAATEFDSLTVLDRTSSFDRSNRILQFTLTPAIPRSNYIRLVAHNNHGDSAVYKKVGFNVKNFPVPPDARHGVTLGRVSSGDSATFRLTVPGKSIVFLKVAPLGQTLATVEPVVMHKDPVTNDWWRNLMLQPGTTYEYAYEFENGQRIYDPWGKWNGTSGTRFSTGQEGLAADNYVWTSNGYVRPPLNRLVIYEMNLGEFVGGYYGRNPGDPNSFQNLFKDLIPLLSHFNNLGVNAIELMPINDYGGVGKSGFSWGYDLNHHFALEPAYGIPGDFKELVDSAHARGIAIIVDAVFNHLNDTGPLWQMSPNEAQNPYFKLGSDLKPNEDGLLFFKDMDHWTSETQEYIYAVLKMWIDEYRVDGFRYDYTQGIGWSTTDTTKGILGWSNRISKEYGDSVYQIAEHLPESPALIYYSGLTGGWHDSFRDEMFAEAVSPTRPLGNFEDLVIGLGAYGGNDTPSEPSRYADRTEPVNATVNHDEWSLMYQMAIAAAQTENLALIRDRLYGTLMFTSLGIPMLWEGMEFGEARGWANDGLKLTYRPVQWARDTLATAQNHFKYYKTLIYQRRYNPALYNGTLKILARYDTMYSYRTVVWGFVDSLSNSKVVVLANLDDGNVTLSNVPWLGTGNWYDVFNNQSVLTVVDTVVASISVPAYQVKMYSNKPDSTLGIPVSVERNGPGEVPKVFTLYQNYPNPFNPSTSFTFSIPEDSRVSLKIYNLLGQEVATLVNADLSPGMHTVNWNGKAGGGAPASSGVYFVRFQANEFKAVRKILLMR